MEPPEDSGALAAEEAAVAAAFLQRYLADLANGGARPEAEYRALWPHHGGVIERELAVCAAGGEDASRADGAGGAPGGLGTLAGYELRAELGRGGQGVVYLAHDPALDRSVALKVLELGPGSRQHLARLRREATVAARLDHPGICGVLDTGVEGGRAWIAMRYVDGETLAARIARARPESGGAGPPREREGLSETLTLFRRAAEALHVAHEAGVVHRDIKPGNLMIARGGEPVLLDFGLAGDELAATLTRTGDLFGTPAYMAPEQLRGQSAGDRLTDVYALGATLYEALVLAPPFAAPTREATYRSILADETPDPREHNDALGRDLAVVVRTALERDRGRRYQTAADLAEDLRRVVAREPIRARPAGPGVRAVRWVQRNPLVTSLAAGLFVTLTGGLAWVSTLLAESESTRSELEDANLELASQLDDVRAGRAKKRADDLQRLLERGFAQAMGATVGDAAATFDELLALEPGHRAALLGRVFVDVGPGADPLTTLDRLVAAAPDAEALATDPDVAWIRALLLDQAGRGDEARALYERAGEAQTALRLYLSGLRAIDWFRPPGDPARAKEAHALFRRAVLHAGEPQFHYAHSLLMSAAYAGDRAAMDEAADLLEHHWPDVPTTWDAIAQFYFPVDPGRAEAALRRQMELAPAAAPCCGLAHAALQRGDEDAARAWYDRALELEPDFAPAFYLRGELLRRQGRLAAARADYLACLERDPTYPPPYDGLLAVHEALGDAEATRADFARLAAEHPEVPHAAERLRQVEANLDAGGRGGR